MNQLSRSDPVASYGFGLLYQQPPEFDVHELRERLAQSIDVEVVSSSDAIIQLGHPDHTVATTAGVMPSLTNIVRWFNPLQISDFADALDQTWDWPEAESVLADCHHKLLVADLTGAALPYKERYRLISTVAVTLAEITHPLAVHWEPAGCLVEPSRLQRRLAWACNVRLNKILNRKDTSLMDTLGLAALGLVDGQCLYRAVDPSEMARWMYGLGKRIFTEGDTFQDGQAVPGPNDAQGWFCRHEPSLGLPLRLVIDAKPPARFAGRR